MAIDDRVPSIDSSVKPNQAPTHGVFLNPVGTIGGAERVLLMTLGAWLKTGTGRTATFILFDNGPLEDAARALGARTMVIRLPDQLGSLGDTQFKGKASFARKLKTLLRIVGTSPSMLRILWKLRDAIRNEAPGFIHSNGLKTHLLLGLLRFRNVKIYWHLHDFYSERPLVGKLLRWVWGQNVTGIAISNAVTADTKLVLPKLRIVTVRNGVDTVKFRPDHSVSAIANLDALAGSGIEKEDAIRIGLIATYANWKGHRVFIEAIAQLLSRKKNEHHCVAYIIGGPIYSTQGSQVSRDELVELAAELNVKDKVRFIPFQSNTAPVYRALDIVVHASTRPEPFGLTIAEAMACGCAVIAANAGGAAEIFEHGVNAIGHFPGDLDELANALAKVAESSELRETLGHQARARIVDKFSKERFEDEIVKLLSSTND